MTTPMFLEDDEMRVLTGRAQKAKQIEQLRRMGIPFYVNAAGRPIVARAVIEGTSASSESGAKKAGSPYPWEPAVLRGGKG